MNPITIIRERIAESKRREEGVTEGPWHLEQFKRQFYVSSNDMELKDILSKEQNLAFIASARSDLPMWRSIAEQLLEALEKIAKQKSSQELTEEDRDNADYENAYDMMIDSAQGDLAAIAQQLAEGGIEG